MIEQYNIHSQIYNYTESKILKNHTIHHFNPMIIDHLLSKPDNYK